jgi:tripartite-type tricarboxylate transporter receptor subunit TctC
MKRICLASTFGAAVAATLAGLTLVFCRPVPAAAGEWPTRAVTLVVPFAAGGGTDVMARILAGPMAEILGQDVVVENVTGAGGMIGSAHVARAQLDGYTILFGSRSAAIDMTLYKRPSYSLQNDLSPIVLVADQPTILVARKDLSVDGLREFMIHLKHNAGTMRMGSAGIGSTGFVDCAIFNGMVGVTVQAIPYRGSGPAMQDLIGGHFDYMCTISGSAAGPIQNDMIKPIAVFTKDRVLALPDVPTAIEQGLEFEASTWSGLFAPMGTPEPIIKKIHDAAVWAMQSPAVQEKLAKNATYIVPPEHRSTAYFQSIIGPEIEKNAAPLKAAGMSVD